MKFILELPDDFHRDANDVREALSFGFGYWGDLNLQERELIKVTDAAPDGHDPSPDGLACEAPNAPGWYWVRQPAEKWPCRGAWHCVQVEQDSHHGDGMVAWVPRMDFADPVASDTWAGAQWRGPIAPPANGVPASGLTEQLQRAVEASDEGHDPLCMAILRGKACTCGHDERTPGVTPCASEPSCAQSPMKGPK